MEEEENAIEGLMLLWRRLRATPATCLLDDVLRAMNPASELDLADRQEVYCHCDVLLVVKPFLGGAVFHFHSFVLEEQRTDADATQPSATHLLLQESVHTPAVPAHSLLSILCLCLVCTAAVSSAWSLANAPGTCQVVTAASPPPFPPAPKPPFPILSSPCLLSLRVHLLLCSLCLVSKHCCHPSSHQYSPKDVPPAVCQCIQPVAQSTEPVCDPLALDMSMLVPPATSASASFPDALMICQCPGSVSSLFFRAAGALFIHHSSHHSFA